MENIKGITRQIESCCSSEVVIVQIELRIITEQRPGGVNQGAYDQISRSINRALKRDLNHFISFDSPFIRHLAGDGVHWNRVGRGHVSYHLRQFIN